MLDRKVEIWDEGNFNRRTSFFLYAYIFVLSQNSIKFIKS